MSQRAPSVVDDERPVEDRRPVAAVGAGVHPDTAADRARDRARELEATETRRAHAVQTDRVCSAASREQPLAVDARLGELAAQLEHEPVEPVVGDEQVRAEPDGRHGQPFLARPGQRLFQLVDRLRPCKRLRRAACAERREA